MVEQETVAATLTSALVQARATREAAQARLLNKPEYAARSSNEVSETVDLYLAVLKALQAKT